MSLLRCLSIVTLVLFALFFISQGTLYAEKTSWDAASHWLFDHHILWWSYAVANADAGDSGYYRVWAHCGSGGNYYSGGAYDGVLNASAWSDERTSLAGNEPSPHFSSSYNA